MRIFWIGLGQVGGPMASRAAEMGHDVVGFVRRPRPDLDASGVRTVTSPAPPAGVDVVCLCLFDDAQVRQVLDGGLMDRLARDTVLVNHTTGSPVLARELAGEVPRGVGTLDATFSGNAAMAAQGRLQLMAGGPAKALEGVRPVLSCYADRIAHVGGPGAAQHLKLINNILFAGQLALGRRAIELAQGQGIDAGRALEVLRGSSGTSHALDALAAGPDPGARLDELRHWLDKDVDTARKVACALGIDLGVLGSAVAEFGVAR